MYRAVFFGTPQFAVPFFDALIAHPEIDVVAVITQPDKPAGRGNKLASAPVKLAAERKNILAISPEKIAQATNQITALNPDIFIIFAYGKIIPQSILDIPKFGSVNVHPSRLPEFRGPSPIPAAILSGQEETAISIMLIDDEMDHGPILAQSPLSIESQDTTATLLEKVAQIGPDLLVNSTIGYLHGDIKPIPQDHTKATFSNMLKKEDGRINWHMNAEEIERAVRAFTPWPGTWTAADGKILKIHRANISEKRLAPAQVLIEEKNLYIGTGSTALQILELQLEGKPRVAAADFINGLRDTDFSVV